MDGRRHKPTFSIIIPTLNEERCLPELLTDLQNQTFKDFEVTLVDGNSEDQTIQKAREFRNSLRRLHILRTETRNVCHQRNLGARRAHADWLVFMDADDRIPPYFLQGIRYRIEAHSPDILTTWIQADTADRKDQAIASIVNIYFEVKKTSASPSVLEAMLCVRKAVFRVVGEFNTSLHWGEGSDFIERATKRGFRFEVVRDPRYIYSLRRLRKEGTLKGARRSAQLELARLRRKPLPPQKATDLYPMEGGKYFEALAERPSRLEKIVNRLYRIPPNQGGDTRQGFLTHLLQRLTPRKNTNSSSQ